MTETRASCPQISPQLSVDRRRARYAYECVLAAKNVFGDGDKAERYGGLAEKLPSLLQANGLGATLSFLAAKGMSASNKKDQANKDVRIDSTGPEGKLLLDLAEWLSDGRGFGKKPAHEWLMERLTSEGGAAYRRDMIEMLALSAWLKRLCTALIQKPRKPAQEGTPDHA